MECSNCGEKFKKYDKSYGRKSIFSVEGGEFVENIIGSSVTPKGKDDSRFLCPDCVKLFKTASIGESAKQKLFSKTASGSYVSKKRKNSAADLTTPKKFKTLPLSTSTPKKKQVFFFLN